MADADPFGLLGSHLAEVTVSGLLQWPTPASPQDPLLGLVPQSTTAAFKKGLSSEEWSEDKKDFISARLASSGESIPACETEQLQLSAAAHWDAFYRTNTVNFFKDRHYLEQDFPCLRRGAHQPTVLLEFGCGVGNAFFPLLPRLPKLSVIACDMSSVAINFVKQHPLFDDARVKAFVADPTDAKFCTSDLVKYLPDGGSDIVLMLFMLSAMHKSVHRAAFEAAASHLRPGGYVCFRDYGFMDEAMLRFKQGHKAGEQLYVRGDRTLSYFFKPQELQQHAEAVGLTCCACVYLNRVYENREQGKEMGRIFVHAIFKKPVKTPLTSR